MELWSQIETTLEPRSSHENGQHWNPGVRIRLWIAQSHRHSRVHSRACAKDSRDSLRETVDTGAQALMMSTTVKIKLKHKQQFKCVQIFAVARARAHTHVYMLTEMHIYTETYTIFVQGQHNKECIRKIQVTDMRKGLIRTHQSEPTTRLSSRYTQINNNNNE